MDTNTLTPRRRYSRTFSALTLSGASLLLSTVSAPSQAADAAFQNFLFTACASATGSLAQRCNDSGGGNISGDSESSLNPSQLLSRNANALQESVAGVRALREKDEHQDGRNLLDSAKFGKFSIAVYTDGTQLEHKPTSSERGYQVDMDSVRFTMDYRISPNSFAGLTLANGKSSTALDKYEPSGAFPIYNPEESGSTESDTSSIGLFGGYYFNEALYIDALVLYTNADYEFSRRAVFQNASRNLDLPVTTRGESNGNQLAVGIGLGVDQSWGAISTSAYARLDYQDSEIKGFRESGGNGLGLAVEDVSNDQLLTTLGLRLSRVINTDSVVLVPQGFAEYQQKSNTSVAETTVSLLGDSNNTEFTLRGSNADNRLHRLGVGMAFIWPYGINGFINFSKDYGEKSFDRHQYSAGLRLEF